MPYMFPVVLAKGLSFTYESGKSAVNGVDITLDHGVVHAIVGLSGAGKSTLADLLRGKRPPSGGTIHFHGKLTTPKEYSASKNIRFVGAPRNLDSRVTVLDCLELEGIPTRFGLRDSKAALARAKTLLSSRGLPEVDPGEPICSLPAGRQRLIESAVAVSKQPELLILDDPAAALIDSERAILYDHISQIVRSGAAIAYLTSDPEEALAVGDRVSVLRDGQIISNYSPEEVFVHQLEGEMLGRDLPPEKTRTLRFCGPEVVLRVGGLLADHTVDGVSFAVRRGEVVGLLGLDGAGQSEVVRAIAGDLPRRGGDTFLHAAGSPAKIASVSQALSHGIGYLPDPLRSPTDNVSNPQKTKIKELVQKGCTVFLFDNPTRGLTLNHRLETDDLIASLADNGHGIVIASRDPAELVRLCDRIEVVANGRVVNRQTLPDLSVEKLRRCLRR